MYMFWCVGVVCMERVCFITSSEAETCFQELSNLLSVNTTQNVLVSPLRAAILEVCTYVHVHNTCICVHVQYASK